MTNKESKLETRYNCRHANTGFVCEDCVGRLLQEEREMTIAQYNEGLTKGYDMTREEIIKMVEGMKIGQKFSFGDKHFIHPLNKKETRYNQVIDDILTHLKEGHE